MKVQEEKVNAALELEEIRKYDYELYKKIEGLIIAAKELKLLKEGKIALLR